MACLTAVPTTPRQLPQGRVCRQGHLHPLWAPALMQGILPPPPLQGQLHWVVARHTGGHPPHNLLWGHLSLDLGPHLVSL